MKKIGIITYNRIGDGRYENGVIRRDNLELHICQHAKKEGHAIFKKSSGEDSGPGSRRSQAAKEVVENARKTIDLKELDHVYLYVGKDTGTSVIGATAEIPAEKITYVTCSCNYKEKLNLIQRLGNEDAEIIGCECGGNETLTEIVEGLLR